MNVLSQILTFETKNLFIQQFIENMKEQVMNSITKTLYTFHLVGMLYML